MLIYIIDYAIYKIIIIITVTNHVTWIFFHVVMNLSYEALWISWYKSVCAKLGEHCTAK